jgi:hypothetical protein
MELGYEPVLKRFKSYVETDDLISAQTFLAGLVDEDLTWDYLYQKVYLHACLKKRHAFVEWMNTVFETLEYRVDQYGSQCGQGAPVSPRVYTRSNNL